MSLASPPRSRSRADCLVSTDGQRHDLPGAYGTRAELLERLESCLAFARRTVENANPDHFRWKVDLGQVSGYEKMMMEVGLLALLVSRTGYCDKTVFELARAIRTQYDSSSAVSCILRHPRLAASLGTLLLVLERFGLATPQERAVVHDALESPYLECSEHVPFRLLDRHWVLHLGGCTRGPLSEAIRLSAACRTTHPIYMTREDGYAVTHAIMYATDFGAHAVPAELCDQELWETLDATIAWCTAAGDHDLLTELLLAQLLLRRRLSAYGVIAWCRSRKIWDTLGFLPSPSLSAPAFEAIDEEAEQCQYAYHNMYHTVLVGGLLCAALLGTPVVPPETSSAELAYAEPPSVARAVRGAVDYLQCALQVGPAVARETITGVEWTADTAPVEGLIRMWASDGLATEITAQMAIDASIILAAQDYDLPRLAAALRSAAATRTVTRTVHVGADFLARQSLVGGAIGVGWRDPARQGGSADPLACARATAALANCLVELGERLARNRVESP